MTDVETISLSDLKGKWNDLNQPEFGWAFYRLPGTPQVNFITGKMNTSSIDIMDGNGFIVAPFYHPQNQLWYIENKLHYRLIDNDFAILNSNFAFVPRVSDDVTMGSKDAYEKLVSDIISEIENGHMQKAVPARVKQVPLNNDFSPFKLYSSLLDAYSNAFVYILSTPQTGTWIGCTPEKLLQVKNNEVSTMSLAGTKKTGKTVDENFSSKETEEQAIVTRYINDILLKYCIRIHVDGPHSIEAGNVKHLATYFNGVLKPGYDHNYMKMVGELHPTPAVCGIPLNIARDFLLQNEGFNRSLYSGFLGPIDKSNADIFVNLRCMQVFNQSALLYAGAGVVAGSVPEKEWFETEEKMNTLLRFL